MSQHNDPEKNGNGPVSSANGTKGSVSDIVGWSALELSKAIKNKEVSCVEVMKAYLTRNEDVNPIHNAIVSLRHWMIAGIAGPLYDPIENRDKLKPEAIWEIEGGLALKGKDVYSASIDRSAWYQTVAELFTRYDYVLLPSAQVFPFDATLHWPKEVSGKSMDTYHRWMEIVVPGTLSGCPIANVPVGFNSQGLPMGMQIMGPATQDLSVLQMAHAYEQASGWTKRVPPVHA